MKKIAIFLFLITIVVTSNSCKSDNPAKISDYFIGSWYITKYTFFYGSSYNTINLTIASDGSYSFFGKNDMFFRNESGKWAFNEKDSILSLDEKSYTVIQKNDDYMVLSKLGSKDTFIINKKL